MNLDGVSPKGKNVIGVIDLLALKGKLHFHELKICM